MVVSVGNAEDTGHGCSTGRLEPRRADRADGDGCPVPTGTTECPDRTLLFR